MRLAARHAVRCIVRYIWSALRRPHALLFFCRRPRLVASKSCSQNVSKPVHRSFPLSQCYAQHYERFGQTALGARGDDRYRNVSIDGRAKPRRRHYNWRPRRDRRPPRPPVDNRAEAHPRARPIAAHARGSAPPSWPTYIQEGSATRPHSVVPCSENSIGARHPAFGATDPAFGTRHAASGTRTGPPSPPLDRPIESTARSTGAERRIRRR